MPLTLRTMVPASWKKATVVQGDRTQTIAVNNGSVVYDIGPGKGVATISGN